MHNEVNPPSERRNVGLNTNPETLTSQSALRCDEQTLTIRVILTKNLYNYNRNVILGYTTAHSRAPVANTRN